MADAITGLTLALLGALTTLFIWTPLGFFIWFGLNQEVLFFHEGYRFQAVLFTALFYVFNLVLVYRAIKAKKRKRWALAIYLIWITGFSGFLRVYLSFRQ